MDKKKALITGITGQIGSYLAEILIEKDYKVYGIVNKNLDFILPKIEKERIFMGDIGDSKFIENIIWRIKPDEIYNLAAQSNAQVSIIEPKYTYKINAFALFKICETAKQLKKPIKICQAGSAQIYGLSKSRTINENSLFNPENPYAIAKFFAHLTMCNYRKEFKIFCSNGIIFNSESPRRKENFVTRKITKGLANIIRGKEDQISLGNLNAKRDWIHAKDTARAMYLILQANKPGDYVIASGQTHSVREFAESAFKHVGIDLAWKGEEINERGYDKKTKKTYIRVNPLYFRHAEMNTLTGDSSKAKQKIGWVPEYTFEELVKEMVESDLKK